MARPLSKRWLHPQTVPRGFLRLYAMTLLSRGPETGYSIIQKIDERTDGAWRPGPGTMYPLLKGLVCEGLVQAAPGARVPGAKRYMMTPEGQRALGAMRERLARLGRKERVIARLFSDILPPRVYVPLMLNRYKEGAEQFREKLNEVPYPERVSYLKDLRFFMEAQIGSIDAQLREERAAVQRLPSRPRRRH